MQITPGRGRGKRPRRTSADPSVGAHLASVQASILELLGLSTVNDDCRIDAALTQLLHLERRLRPSRAAR